MKHEKACGCIIINDNKALMIHQNNGLVGFPKGHVENDETEEETAIRKTKEETNLDVSINKDLRFETNYIVKGNIYKEVVYFISKKLSNDIIKQDKEIKDIKWVPIDEVLDLLQYDNIKKLWKEVLKKISS